MNFIRLIFFCMYFMTLCVFDSFAQEICPIPNDALRQKSVISLKNFESIAILSEGRIKPLDTYARTLLLQFSGKKSYNRKPAMAWLARLLIAPETTKEDKIFVIHHPEIATAIGIQLESKNRYSFSQLQQGYSKLSELAQAALQIDSKERGIVEQELIRIHENLKLYAKLSHSFVFVFPHPDFTIDSFDLKQILELPEEQQQFSFLDMVLRADKIYQLTRNLEVKNQFEWTEDEKTLLGIMTLLYHWSFAYRNLPFNIIPSYDSNDENWYSPWDTINQGLKSPNLGEEIILLRNLVLAYWQGRQIEFDLAAKKFTALIGERINPKQKLLYNKIPLELFLNKANIFFYSKIFYLATFFIFLISLIYEKKFLYSFGFSFLILGFVSHGLGIFIRIMILGRPPVSSLYETFLFVALISVMLGIIIERFNKQWLGMVVASIAGYVLLLIAGKFSQEGDTLKMLIAVLNSNFWLSTHVLSITSGYAGCSVAGLIGHFYIIQALLKSDKKILENTYRHLVGILGFGLTMTFLGTNLGGIWADQSWGRFWGWDPKENGALLIILWCAIIFHARVGKMIGPLGVAVGSVIGMMVVMWAWFGVNVLSVGLHSYGFTSGIAYGLIIFIIFEIFFLFLSLNVLKWKRKKAILPSLKEG